MRQADDSTVALPSHTVLAHVLSSTAQLALDFLWGNDPWASAVALRPVQQQQQQKGRIVAQLQCNGDKASREVHRIPRRDVDRSTTRIRSRFLGCLPKRSHVNVVLGARETTVDDV